MANSSGILLIQPYYPSSPFPGAHIPVGLGYLAEQLGANRIPYLIVDMNLHSFNELCACIESFDPPFIGISLMSLDIASHVQLISRIKSLYPTRIVIAGGAHVSFMREQVLHDCPAIDIGVVNEGELALQEILSGQRYQAIRGIVFRHDGEIIYTGERQFVQDLDRLGFPRYEGFDLARYGKAIDLISSRGCPFGCVFCGAHFSMGKKWRSRTVASIFDEIVYWCNKGYTEFHFVDSNFFFDKQRIVDLCDSLKDAKLNIKIYSDGMRGDDADIEMLLKMKELGLSSVAIGVESANDEVLVTIKKRGEISTDRECHCDMPQLGH